MGETMDEKKYRSVSHGRYGNRKRVEQVKSYSTLKRVGDGPVDIDGASLFPRDQPPLLQQNNPKEMHMDFRDIDRISVFHVLKKQSEKKYRKNDKMEKKFGESLLRAQ